MYFIYLIIRIRRKILVISGWCWYVISN